MDVNGTIEAFVKIQKKKKFVGGGGVRVGGRRRLGGWGQGGCERRIEVFAKIQKKIWGGGGGGGSGVQVGGGGGGVRMDVNEELKFL